MTKTNDNGRPIGALSSPPPQPQGDHDRFCEGRNYTCTCGYDDARETLESFIGLSGKFALGDRVRKTKGSSWQGRVVGFYRTELTPIGYAVESEREPGSVQIYPESALAKLEDQP